MATRLPLYLMRDGVTRLGQSYFNPVWADLDNRLDALERLEVDWQAQVAQLRDLGLVRIDDYIRPLTDEVDRLIAQARDETDNLAATLVSEHLLPLVAKVQQLLQQAQSDTAGLAQTLVDDHIGPQLIQAHQLLSQIQQIKQTAGVETEDIAQQLVDDHIAPLLTHAEQLRGQIQQLKQAASTDADAIAQLLANAGWQDQLNTLKNEMAPLSHNHAIDGVTGLTQALAGKAPSNHNHAIGGITGLTQALDGKRSINNNSFPRYDLLRTATTSTLNLAASQVFRVNASASRTLSFSNTPAAGRAMTVVIHLHSIGQSSMVTWPAGINWSGGEAPVLEGGWMTVVLLRTGDEWVGLVSMQG